MLGRQLCGSSVRGIKCEDHILTLQTHLKARYAWWPSYNPSTREAKAKGDRQATRLAKIPSFMCSKRDQELRPQYMKNLLWCLERLGPDNFAVHFKSYLKTNTKPTFLKEWFVCACRVHMHLYVCPPV